VFKVPAHHCFVIGPALFLRFGLRLEPGGVSHLIHTASSTLVLATSLIEVSGTTPGVELVIASHVLLVLKTASSSASLTSSATGALVTIVPLYRLQSQLHQLSRDGIVRLSQLGVAVGEMAILAQDAVLVCLVMATPLSLVLLIDLVLAVLRYLLVVHILSIVLLTHVHLVHVLLHHLHLVGHHTWLHLHLHVLMLALHLHVVHLIRLVHHI
jgi:hypothetical protein